MASNSELTDAHVVITSTSLKINKSKADHNH